MSKVPEDIETLKKWAAWALDPRHSAEEVPQDIAKAVMNLIAYVGTLKTQNAEYKGALLDIDREVGRGNLEDGCDYATKPGRDVCHRGTIEYLKTRLDEVLPRRPDEV